MAQIKIGPRAFADAAHKHLDALQYYVSWASLFAVAALVTSVTQTGVEGDKINLSAIGVEGLSRQAAGVAVISIFLVLQILCFLHFWSIAETFQVAPLEHRSEIVSALALHEWSMNPFSVTSHFGLFCLILVWFSCFAAASCLGGVPLWTGAPIFFATIIPAAVTIWLVWQVLCRIAEDQNETVPSVGAGWRPRSEDSPASAIKTRFRLLFVGLLLGGCLSASLNEYVIKIWPWRDPESGLGPRVAFLRKLQESQVPDAWSRNVYFPLPPSQ